MTTTLTRHDILHADAIKGVRALLELAGEDPDRDGLVATPGRVVAAYLEMTARPGEPKELLARQFDAEGPIDQIIAVGPVPFTSTCEHHLMAFHGHAWIGYLPSNGKIVGLSKLPRLLEHFALRLQVQERMTRQVAEAIMEHAGALGAACVIKAKHSCMTNRGIRKPDAMMTTSHLIGPFRDNPECRAEFLALSGM